ncbi:MAG: beta-ketoacyl-[acyl-carrier-protein] synthase family protein [Planctomycetes bacterium]|nr:beta-ketoacyl-[acyl-carrier-protein] synthase family protein [Planctomycetota bacterium]
MSCASPYQEPIVVTGIGMITSVGPDRESTWRAVRQGVSGVRRVVGLEGIPDGLLLGAPVMQVAGMLHLAKVIALSRVAAIEAIEDSALDVDDCDHTRIACAISAHMGDTGWFAEHYGRHDLLPAEGLNWNQWLPNSACVSVAEHYGFAGPRIGHSTACASGLMDVLAAIRSLRDDQCDVALAGSAEAFHPLFAAGFRQLRVLAEHDEPTKASRPFDKDRNGFVMGEGAAMFVLERLGHAIARGARIYAELCGGTRMAEAHHETGLDTSGEAIAHLIRTSLERADFAPRDIGYVSAHATGTRLNDAVEARAIRLAFGSAADRICVGANKSGLGHLVNAASSVELALTILTLRDGFAPPTLNLEALDPECDLDCVPLVGRTNRVDHALKLCCAFGGHLAAIGVKRWNHASSGFGYPMEPARAA